VENHSEKKQTGRVRETLRAVKRTLSTGAGVSGGKTEPRAVEGGGDEKKKNVFRAGQREAGFAGEDSRGTFVNSN